MQQQYPPSYISVINHKNKYHIFSYNNFAKRNYDDDTLSVYDISLLLKNGGIFGKKSSKKYSLTPIFYRNSCSPSYIIMNYPITKFRTKLNNIVARIFKIRFSTINAYIIRVFRYTIIKSYSYFPVRKTSMTI